MTILSHATHLAFSSAALIAGVTIIYRRGDQSKEIPAIAGSQTLLQAADWENLIHKTWRESFIIDPADLRGIFGEPRAGDEVTFDPPGRPDIRLHFTLRADDNNQPAFRPTDCQHTRWRVNTILTRKEALP